MSLIERSVKDQHFHQVCVFRCPGQLNRKNLNNPGSEKKFKIENLENQFACLLVLQFQGFTRIMVGLNVSIPLFCSAFVLRTLSVYTDIPLYTCLGEEYMTFLLEKQTPGTFFETAWAWSWSLILAISMSNILDFFIYSCSKAVERSDENVKNMISHQAYLKRKR